MAAALPFVMIASTVASTFSSMYGAQQSAQAAAQAASYNAAVDKGNQQIALQNATYAGQAGEAQAGLSEMKTRANVGAIKANQAASGVDVNSGSAVDTRSSAAALGQLDALTIRSNAAREAYGYQTAAYSHGAAAGLGKAEAAADIQAGKIGAATTLLGGAGDAASQFYKFQQSGAFGGGLDDGASSGGGLMGSPLQ